MAYRAVEKHPSGKAIITFNPLKARQSEIPMRLRCGKCIGCRLDNIASWSLRCTHEAKMHQASSFITLTYDDEHLPPDYSVNLRTFQLFMKRLRKELPMKIKFYGCGEYGDLENRPHYHALIFGWDFHNDRKLHKVTKDGPLYTSPTLNKVWPYGFNTVGQVTYKSAGYTAGYLKTRSAENNSYTTNKYTRTHPITSDVVRVEPEFGTMSGGLGLSFIQKFKSDYATSDFFVVDGQQVAVPRYYTLKLTEEEQSKIKTKRQISKQRIKPAKNKTKERLAVRETVKKAQLKAASKRTL
ncbi:replication initiator protein [robinz microvirus RP_104]|nr:replication initiator protein [robinz microvirus RP_104]